MLRSLPLQWCGRVQSGNLYQAQAVEPTVKGLNALLRKSIQNWKKEENK